MAEVPGARALRNLIRTTLASLPRRIRTAKRGTMPSPSDRDMIKITAEDLASVVLPAPAVSVAGAQSSGAKVYGTINETAEQFVSVPSERGSILLQGWFYLGLAGMLGALTAWGIAEPGFRRTAPALSSIGEISSSFR